MKHSRAEVHRKTFAIPKLRFEDQTLTSFSGLIVFQKLFTVLGLNARLRRCFSHQGILTERQEGCAWNKGFLLTQ
jgi:hypothetical protein